MELPATFAEEIDVVGFEEDPEIEKEGHILDMDINYNVVG
jgi:hypothetical protein